jgi:hypothetical protein
MSRKCCSQNANRPAKTRFGGEANEYEKSGGLTNQTEFLELSVNAVGLIVKSVSRVKIVIIYRINYILL